MIIDFHTHTFPDKIAAQVIAKLERDAGTKAHISATKDALLASMREAGVALSVILPVVTAPRQTETINAAAVQTNEQYGERGLLSFGGIHPDDGNYIETLQWIAAHGLKGIKLHPVYQKVDFDDMRTMRIVDKASELGLIVSVHSGIDIGVEGDEAAPERMLRVIREVKPEKLVLAHFGAWNQFDEVEELLAGQDVYFDTAFAVGRPYLPLEEGGGTALPDLCSAEQFVRIMRKHGSDKILFATDSPWSSQKREIQVIRSLPITQEEQRRILGENAKRLLGL